LEEVLDPMKNIFSLNTYKYACLDNRTFFIGAYNIRRIIVLNDSRIIFILEDFYRAIGMKKFKN